MAKFERIACINCDWWDNEDGFGGNPTDPDYCRVNAPGAPPKGGGAPWPTTYKYDWCGRFPRLHHPCAHPSPAR